MKASHRSIDFQFWQALYDLHCFEAYCNDSQQELEWVRCIIQYLLRPKVGVVDYVADFISGHRLAFDHPLNFGLAVDNVILRLQRNVFHGYVVVVEDLRAVVDTLARLSIFGLGELQLADIELIVLKAKPSRAEQLREQGLQVAGIATARHP
ncbi:MAG: hypothetical protein WCK15_05615 [Pirellula sp.]